MKQRQGSTTSGNSSSSKGIKNVFQWLSCMGEDPREGGEEGEDGDGADGGEGVDWLAVQVPEAPAPVLGL